MDKNLLNLVEETFPRKVTEYYASLAEKSHAISRQCQPDPVELESLSEGAIDPNAEVDYSPLPRLIHKYPTKVAILVADDCFMYCRHCTRKHFVLKKALLRQMPEWNHIITYLTAHPGIADVLLTGGDALYLSDEELENILLLLDKVDSVKTIRIGTRAIVTCPQRITDGLIKTLKGHKPIWIQTQFNHKDELTPQSRKAVRKLIANGFQINNQTVLLKGVNDNDAELIALFTALTEIGVRPYYLYHCDNVPGVRHFVTDYGLSRQLVRRIAANLPGYAMPRYILDTPTKYGKLCVEINHVKSFADESIVFDIDGHETIVKI